MARKKADKRKEAEERQAAYNKLTLDQKIKKAAERGGSKKELARLEGLKKNSK